MIQLDTTAPVLVGRFLPFFVAFEVTLVGFGLWLWWLD